MFGSSSTTRIVPRSMSPPSSAPSMASRSSQCDGFVSTDRRRARRLRAAMGVLDEILATKRDEVTVLRRPDTRDLLRRTALAAPPTRGFAAALRAKPVTVAVIAEIKRRSPSKGPLALDLDPVATARAYVSGGA